MRSIRTVRSTALIIVDARHCGQRLHFDARRTDHFHTGTHAAGRWSVIARDGSLISRFPMRRMIAVEGINAFRHKTMSEELVVQKTRAAGTLESVSLPVATQDRALVMRASAESRRTRDAVWRWISGASHHALPADSHRRA
jgi:hypothetical protein